MPARVRWIASASVPVARAEADTVNGIPSSSAAECSSSNTRGLMIKPHSITGPEPNSCERIPFAFTPGAHVHVEVFQLHDFFALLAVAHQVDRLAPDHAGDAAVASHHLDPLSDQDLRVPPADAGEVEKALVVVVGDDQPDLVDVADHR